MRGEEKDFITVWLTLGQRTLRYETYVMPAPEENAAAVYEHLLRRNEKLVGAHFSIGDRGRGVPPRRAPAVAVSTRTSSTACIGTLYATVEQSFRALLRTRLRQPIRTLTFFVALSVSRARRALMVRCPGGSIGECRSSIAARTVDQPLACAS